MSVRSLSATLALSVALVSVGAGVSTASARPSSYELPGDTGGSKFEGIGYDARTQRYYVSETTGGEIHRGQLRSATATPELSSSTSSRTRHSWPRRRRPLPRRSATTSHWD